MATRVEKKDFSKYLVEARSWESDKVRSLETAKRTAWIVASVASILAAISIVTVALLTPVQRVEAYVVRVDSGTGTVNVVKQLTNGDTNYDEAINKYFTQWYVRWREGYIQDRTGEFYTNVGILSSPAEQSRYLKQFDPANPKSPVNVYRNFGRSVITIERTVLDKPGVAQIYFTKEEDWAGKDHKTSHWVAMVFYRFTGAPMSDKNREINPLGFQVMNYTVAEEKPAEKEVQAPAGQVAGERGATSLVRQHGVTVPAIAPATPGVPVRPAGSANVSTSASSPASTSGNAVAAPVRNIE